MSREFNVEIQRRQLEEQALFHVEDMNDSTLRDSASTQHVPFGITSNILQELQGILKEKGMIGIAS